LKNPKLFLLLALLIAPSCDLIKIKDQPKDAAQGQPVARVAEKYLYDSELAGLVPTDATEIDSLNIVDRYVKNWIKKQLMIKEAENEIQFDELELQRKLLDYKYALMVYEFEKFYVDRNLEEQITNAEIEKYYQKNKDNFILKQNLIKGLFIKLPKEAPRTNRLKKMMLSKSDQDFEDLRSYCYRFATKYVLEDTIWLNFDEVFQGTPIQNLEDQERYLRENQYVETKDENFLYFIRIDEYRLKEQISPLEFEIENIINLILNKRKADLANQLEEDIYNEAVKKNEFEIYN